MNLPIGFSTPHPKVSEHILLCKNAPSFLDGYYIVDETGDYHGPFGTFSLALVCFVHYCSKLEE